MMILTLELPPISSRIRLQLLSEVPDSFLSLFDEVEQNIDASIADLCLSPSANNANANEIEKDVAAAAAMKPLLTDCNVTSDPVEEKIIANSVDLPRSNVQSVSMIFSTDNDNAAISYVAAAAAMAPISAKTDKADNYEAAAVKDRAPAVAAAAAAAAMTIFYAEETRETESYFAAAGTVKMVIHEPIILRHSTEPDNGIILHKSPAAAAAEDDVFTLVDNLVPSDNADAIGILGLPVHTRLLTAGVTKSILLPSDLSPSDRKYMNGEPDYETNVLKDGEPYEKQAQRQQPRQ